MSRVWTGRRVVSVVLAWSVALVLVVWPGTSPGQPPQGPDPRAMSGIPRLDSNLPSGTIVVRCLRGSFSDPVVGVEVSLHQAGAGSGATAMRTATTVQQGRARFDGLNSFIGSEVVVSATLDGETVRSRPIPVSARGGAAVLLVTSATPPGSGPAPVAESIIPAAGSGTGAGSAPAAPPGTAAAPAPGAGPATGAAVVPGAAANPAGPHGGADGVPLPGRPFPLKDRAVGTLLVATFDVGQMQPLPGIEVTLTIDLPNEAADPAPRKAVSTADGRAVFENLVGDAFPPGTAFTAAAILEKGGEPQRSESFEMPADTAQAVMLLRGKAKGAAPGASRRVPPRADPTVPAGTVRVKLVDAADGPVADQPVAVVKQTMAGTDVRFHGVTDKSGSVDVTGVAVQHDAFYGVETLYDGAPYRSSMFELQANHGARVELRVFETTADVRTVRSAVQFDVVGREHDRARVLQMYEVLNQGDKAFWVPGGFRIHAARGGHGLQTMRQADSYLEVEEGAPFADLRRPLPPGERVVLSIAYLMDHGGDLTIDWRAPFPVIEASASLELGLTVREGASGPPTTSPSGAHGPGVPAVQMVPLEAGAYEDGPCEGAWRTNPRHECSESDAALGGAAIRLVVDGLPAHDPIFRHLALGFALLLALAVAISLIWGGRVSLVEALTSQRDMLFARLRELDGGTESAERRRLVELLDRIYRQLDVLGSGSMPK